MSISSLNRSFRSTVGTVRNFGKATFKAAKSKSSRSASPRQKFSIFNSERKANFKLLEKDSASKRIGKATKSVAVKIARQFEPKSNGMLLLKNWNRLQDLLSNREDYNAAISSALKDSLRQAFPEGPKAPIDFNALTNKWQQSIETQLRREQAISNGVNSAFGDEGSVYTPEGRKAEAELQTEKTFQFARLNPLVDGLRTAAKELGWPVEG